MNPDYNAKPAAASPATQQAVEACRDALNAEVKTGSILFAMSKWDVLPESYRTLNKIARIAKDYGLDVWVWYPALDRDYSDPKTVEFALKEWGAVFNEGNLAEDTREDTLARRDKLVTLLRESDWYMEQPDGEDSALAQRVRELEATDDDFEVNNLVIAIYDLADVEWAWLDPDQEGADEANGKE